MFDPWRQKAVCPSRTFAAGARLSVVGSEAVGVLEPGGHFVLVALADGHTIADVQLEVRPNFSLTDLVVVRMGDQYIVLTNDNRVPGNAYEQQAQPPQGMSCFALRRGRIHALDLQGKLAWPAPVDVDGRQFPLSQPGRLPVLLFAAFRYATSAAQPGQTTLQTLLVAVDRRNGRIVYNRDVASAIPWGSGTGMDISGDPAEKAVRIATDNNIFRLTFTDKPIRTTVPQKTGVKQ
jgi:hypothetical protein